MFKLGETPEATNQSQTARVHTLFYTIVRIVIPDLNVEKENNGNPSNCLL